MAVTDVPTPSATRRTRRVTLLGGLAGLVALICLLPVAGVLCAALLGNLDTLTHLSQTVLPRYVGNTVALVCLVCTGTLLIGTACGWLVTMAEFPGRRWLEIALVLPLAFPAYVLAYAYTHLLDHPGIVQASLRAVTGWGPRDYWFPEVRSLGGAAMMLTLVLYPYVYLLARAAFLSQSAQAFLAARALGRRPLEAFLTVSVPMARPAIAAGVMLVAMETIADFGTVDYFAVQTLSTGIYASWFLMGDRAAAAQLSLALLAFALVLAAVERSSRGNARYHGGKRQERLPRLTLAGPRAWAASLVCALPVALGVVIPVAALGVMTLDSEQNLLSPRYLAFIQNSLIMASVAALVTMAAAVVLGTAHRTSGGRAASASLLIGRLGYALPGGVIAVGLLVPLAGLDNLVNSLMKEAFGISTGLLLTGSIFALTLAYMIRFLAAALGAYEGGIAGVSGNIDAASRVLGKGPWGTLQRVHLPMLTPSLLTGLLIVFVDVMKELPATLIMRPFNFDTLAVQAYRLAKDERLEGAAVPSLVLVTIGLIPVILLCRQVARRRG